MTKKEVLIEIKEFRKSFNKIKPEQFYFGRFVTKHNEDRTCGTVCCLWGWIPQIAPKIAKRYMIYYDFFKITDMSNNPECLLWPSAIIDYLFYPEKSLVKLPLLFSNTDLAEVLKAWDSVIHILENTKKLDHLFK